MRIRPLVLLATLGAAVAVSSTACTGDGGGDGGESPTPTPVFEADRCQIVWENDVEGSVKDVYLLDAPAGAWVLSSAHQYSFSTTGFQAAFLGGLDLDTGASVLHVVTSAGTFALDLNGTAADLAIHFEDTIAQALYTLDSAGAPASFVGTGGSGTFSGVWSDPLSQNVMPGNGTVSVLLDGTARTIGIDLSYAVCYTGPGTLLRPSHRRLR